MANRPKPTLRGCITTLALIAIIGYGGLALLGFAWWGSGFLGSILGRHAPDRIRSANRIVIYDHVIEVEGKSVTFRHSKWSRIRRALLPGRSPADDVVRVARPARGEVVAVHFDIGGGRSGTRQTTSWMTGYDILLRDGANSVILVRLPYNDEEDAAVWRDLIAEKLR